MLVMESASSHNKSSCPQTSFRHNCNGYKPSNTETECKESPWHEGLLPLSSSKTPDPVRRISSFQSSQGQTSKDGYENTSIMASRNSPITRGHSKSPYKPIRDGNDVVPSQYAELRKNASPIEVSEHRQRVSLYKARQEEFSCESNDLGDSFQKQNRRTPLEFLSATDKAAYSQHKEVSKVNERSNDSRRSRSVPKLRARERQQQISSGLAVHGASQSSLPLAQTMTYKRNEGAYASNPSPYEINEIIANMKLTKSSSSDALSMEITESIAPGDIFFSLDGKVMQKISEMKNSNLENNNAPQFEAVPEKNNVHKVSGQTTSFNQVYRAPSVSTVLSGTNSSSSFTVSQLSNSTISNESTYLSDISGKLKGSLRYFVANQHRGQTDAWFSCVRGRSCRKSTSSLESETINGASFLEKALVVEEMRLFWADKHMPRSLNGFICHKQQAQRIKLLESRPVQIVVPLTSSPHHVEINLKSESKVAKHALMAIIKEIAGNCARTPEFSDTSFTADFKVIVLYDVDKYGKSVQHLIKWIIDCYTESCKIMLCCEDDTDLLDSVKSRCKLITVDAPVTYEIAEVLLQIAKKEDFELSVNFAAKIPSKSKQNMRRAIMALEACKANNYPFVDGQPIPLGWEEVLVELASKILADPTPKRLFFARQRLQKLLVEFVHPKLILQKLVEQFLMGIEADLKRGLYFWHAYYDKRPPVGTSALLKLEEFLAKFMSIYRKALRAQP